MDEILIALTDTDFVATLKVQTGHLSVLVLQHIELVPICGIPTEVSVQKDTR